MAKLPYSRVVNVTLSRKDNFPTKRGFGVALLLTKTAVTGKVDATTRTKVYGSIDEVVVDFATTTDVYKAALEAFSQNPRPIQIKVGYVDMTTTTAANLQAQMDLLYDQDNEWYWVGIEAAMRDQAYLDGLITWVQAKNKFALIDSNAIATQTFNDTTSVAGRNKGLYDRSAVFYHTDPTENAGFALAALLGTRNFDQANSAYTAKFKKLIGVAPLNLGSSKIQAITGFTPALGMAVTTGNCANTIIDIGGQAFVVEGSTLTPNVFIDQIHATDWIIARTEEEALGILLNNDRVPFDDKGMEMLASAARIVMASAIRAGLIASDFDPLTGAYAPAIEYSIPSVFDVPASQRVNRIAPPIAVKFRYAGAVHYTTINYTMTF